MSIINVALGARSYPIVIGSDLASRLPSRLKKVVGGNRMFVIYDAQVYALHGRHLDQVLSKAARVVSFVIPVGERSKSLIQLNRLRDFLLAEKITRSDVIVAVGGGVVSDLVGYAAATTLRGINWVIISTTLLGMVDAAIGGKTGINHHRGKNLIGAFWQPRLVWCDTGFLMTLPKREIIAGLGEVLKYAGLIGNEMIKQMERYLGADNVYDIAKLGNLIESCVSYKATIVEADEHDTGRRRILNFGHTFGHAIETGAGHGRLRHGEALIIGLKAAVHLSGVYFPAGKRSLGSYHGLIEFLRGLVPHRKIDTTLLWEALALDKKRAKSGQNFILLQRPGKPIIARDVKVKDIQTSLRHAFNGFGPVERFDG